MFLNFSCPVIIWQVNYKFISLYSITLFMIAFKIGNNIDLIRIKGFYMDI